MDPRCADPTRTRGYREEYVYDRANNLREIRHQPASGSAPTRYLEIVGNSNRLAALRIGDATTAPRFVYQYDSAGNLTAEATDRYLEWDYHQRLRSLHPDVRLRVRPPDRARTHAHPRLRLGRRARSRAGLPVPELQQRNAHRCHVQRGGAGAGHRDEAVLGRFRAARGA